MPRRGAPCPTTRVPSQRFHSKHPVTSSRHVKLSGRCERNASRRHHRHHRHHLRTRNKESALHPNPTTTAPCAIARANPYIALLHTSFSRMSRRPVKARTTHQPDDIQEDVRMRARSHLHHEVPKWLLKRFGRDPDKMLWVGSKDTREVRRISAKVTFARNDANTRTDYQSRGDGTFQQAKSDQDETLLANFDSQASRAAGELIDFARQWRDAGLVAPGLPPETVTVVKRLIVAQARRPRESQDRVGLNEDGYQLYLDLYLKRAEEVGQRLPSRENLLADPDVDNRGVRCHLAEHQGEHGVRQSSNTR